MSKYRHISLLLVIFTIAVTCSYSQSEGLPAEESKIPKLFKRITDFTNTLTASELDALELALARFEDSTSTQVLVVMVSSVGGEAIEEFALRTAEANQIGQKQRDNGVLLLIAKDDRRSALKLDTVSRVC